MMRRSIDHRARVAQTTTMTTSGNCPAIRGPLLGSFEENVLNNRLKPIRSVDGFSAELRASGGLKFQSRPMSSLIRVDFLSLGGSCFPYLGRMQIGRRGYRIPRKGTLQVTLFNPQGTIEKLFLLLYDLSDMPPNSHTILRQRTVQVSAGNKNQENTSQNELCDSNNNNNDIDIIDKSNQVTRANLVEKQTSDKIQETGGQQQQQQVDGWRRIRYLIQLNIISSKSGKIYLNRDLRIFVSKNVDLEAASQLLERNYELHSFEEMPKNPRYFARG